MIRTFVKSSAIKSNLITRNLIPTFESIRLANSKTSDHLYGIEQVQYLNFKKKIKLQNESENIAILEDDDMLSVYLSKRVRRTETTADKPIYVPSMENTRMICCHCDLEGLDLTYTMLEKNKVIKCNCGYHFKLIDQLDPFIKSQ